MQVRLEKLFRTLLFLCIVLIGWTLFAEPAEVIRLVSPKEHVVLSRGANLRVEAEVNLPPEKVRGVEFFADKKLLGVATNSPYTLTWTNIPVGNVQLTARLVDDSTNRVVSLPVKVRVHPSETWLTFGLDHVDVLTVELFEIPVWQYLAAFIYIFLAFYVSKFLDYATRVWLKRLTEKTDTKLDDLLLDLIHGPVKIVSFVVFLYIGLRVFTWAQWINEFLPKAFKFIVIVVIAYVLIKGVDLLLGVWKERSSADDKAFDDQLFPIIRKSLKAFIFVVTFLFICDNVFNQDIKAILTSLSIGGLAIGLAAQDTIANFFGAVVVFIDKPFRIGDRIQLADVDGVVESIGMRSTRVRSLNGYLITVPNKTMGNATITNISSRPTIKTEINYGLTYDTSDEKLTRALSILEEIYQKNPNTHDAIITFNKFGDSALNIMVVHWWKNTDAKAQIAGMQEMNLAVKKRFAEEKIEFAFPSQTVYVKQDPSLLEKQQLTADHDHKSAKDAL